MNLNLPIKVETFLGSFRPALRVFCYSRLLVLLVVLLSIGLKLEKIPAREGINYNPKLELHLGESHSRLKKILLSADSSWYLEIAKTGYSQEASNIDTPRNWVFFPLLPLLERSLSWAPGGLFGAGLLISNLSFLLALTALHYLGLAKGLSERESRRMIWFLAFFPTSYFFISPLTEPLFLLLSLMTFLQLSKSRPGSASFWMLLTCLSRPTGLLLYPAYLLELLSLKLTKTRTAILTLVPLLGPLAFMFYLEQLTGNALAWKENQIAWGRTNDLGMLLEELALLPSTLMIPWNFLLLNLLASLLGFAAAVHLFIKKNYAWSLILLVPLLTAISTGTLISTTRFLMALFPLYFVLAKWSDDEEVQRVILSLFALALGLMTALWSLHVTAAMA